MFHFGKKGKLAPRYIGSFEILQRVGEVAYQLALPQQLLGIHDVVDVSLLRKYEPDVSHILDWQQLKFQENMKYEEWPRNILDVQQRVLRNKVIHLVKVLWEHHGVEEATWELEADVKKRYSELFTG